MAARPRGAALAALAASLAVLGRAIRLPGPPSSSDGPPIKLREGPAGVPGIDDFERDWRRLLAAEETNEQDVMSKILRDEVSRNASAAKHIWLVLGVFSSGGPQDQPYRNTIRRTWMRGPWVCTLANSTVLRKDREEGPSTGCLVHTTFVIGNDTQATDEEDLVVLPIHENMNGGKTRVWFEYAAKHFPWATHIAKMDMDAFPHVSRMLFSMSRFDDPCENVYGGVQLHCTQKSACPKRCGRYDGDDFLSYDIPDPACYSYMQGGLYLLSAGLAAKVSQPGPWWDRDANGSCWPEDIATGRAITAYAREHQLCVAALQFPRPFLAWHGYVQRMKVGCE